MPPRTAPGVEQGFRERRVRAPDARADGTGDRRTGIKNGGREKKDGPQGTLGVDDEQAAERDALLLDEHIVVAGDGHGLVRDKWQLQVGPEATLLARLGRPGEMGEVGVGRHTYGWRGCQ